MAAKGMSIIQFDKDDIADLGLMKLDLLSLRTLSAVQTAIGDIHSSKPRTKGIADATGCREYRGYCSQHRSSFGPALYSRAVHFRSQKEMGRIGQDFIAQAMGRGVTQKVAQTLFSYIVGYAGYGFCFRERV